MRDLVGGLVREITQTPTELLSKYPLHVKRGGLNSLRAGPSPAPPKTLLPAALYKGVSRIGGTLLGGPYHQETNSLGSLLWLPQFRELPRRLHSTGDECVVARCVLQGQAARITNQRHGHGPSLGLRGVRS